MTRASHRAALGARSWWRSKARLSVLALAVTWALAVRRGEEINPAAPSPAAAIAEVLTARGLGCQAADVTWIDPPGGVPRTLAGRSRALVRARAAGDLSDLYLVAVRRSPEGTLLAVGDNWDLTNTSGVDESTAIVRGSMAAYTTSAEGVTTGIHVIDLSGPGAQAYEGMTRLQRIQSKVTNWQETGQTSGIVHTAFALDALPAATAPVTLAWKGDGTLIAHADGYVIAIDPKRARALAGADRVRVIPDELSRPGNLVTWAVDRVRDVSWIGDAKMQWVKAIAFTLLDKVHATFSRAATSEDIKDELGLTGRGGTSAARAATYDDPEIGWPPAPIDPVFPKPLPGEGQWIALDGDPFITKAQDGTTPAFVTSFVRPDRERADVRVYATLWDPRQIALHMEAGTVEPI
ncbi:MAG: hypothetical protein ACREJ3_01995, partial [Polyangiaceae bacterium]